MAGPVSDELYALRSPLSPATAAERLKQLGPVAHVPTEHHRLVEVELAVLNDPLAPAIDLQIESRASGSYVTARIATSRFLLDFARVVRVVLTLYALGIGLYACIELQGSDRAQTIIGVACGWTLLLALLSVGVRATTDRAYRELRLTRLRHQLASLLCR